MKITKKKLYGIFDDEIIAGELNEKLKGTKYFVTSFNVYGSGLIALQKYFFFGMLAISIGKYNPYDQNFIIDKSYTKDIEAIMKITGMEVIRQ